MLLVNILGIYEAIFMRFEAFFILKYIDLTVTSLKNCHFTFSGHLCSQVYNAYILDQKTNFKIT